MGTRRKKRKSTIYRVRQGASRAAYQFLSAFGIFSVILVLTGFFILFQWKNVKIQLYLEQIDKLKHEILILNVDNSQLVTTRNELLKQVPEIAQQKLQMTSQIEIKHTISLNKKNLVKYEQKE
jgi:hypothetical protein